MNARKMDTHTIVSAASEAAQMAEDARSIAVKRREEDRRGGEIQHSEKQSELRRKGGRRRRAGPGRCRGRSAGRPLKPARAAAQAEAQARAAQQAVSALRRRPSRRNRGPAFEIRNQRRSIGPNCSLNSTARSRRATRPGAW